MIFCYTLENTRSFNERATHFKGLIEQPNRREGTIPETNRAKITEINQLNEPFSIREIEQFIKSLKRNKGADLDNDVGDFSLIRVTLFVHIYEHCSMLFLKLVHSLMLGQKVSLSLYLKRVKQNKKWRE